METRLCWNGTFAVMKINVCKNRNSKFIYFPSHCEMCAYGTIKNSQNSTHGKNVHFGLRLYKSGTRISNAYTNLLTNVIHAITNKFTRQRTARYNRKKEHEQFVSICRKGISEYIYIYLFCHCHLQNIIL